NTRIAFIINFLSYLLPVLLNNNQYIQPACRKRVETPCPRSHFDKWAQVWRYNLEPIRTAGGCPYACRARTYRRTPTPSRPCTAHRQPPGGGGFARLSGGQ